MLLAALAARCAGIVDEVWLCINSILHVTIAHFVSQVRQAAAEADPDAAASSGAAGTGGGVDWAALQAEEVRLSSRIPYAVISILALFCSYQPR